LWSRSPKRGLPFSSHVYYSSSSQKSFSLFKFEKTFEAIRKNDKETSRRYNFRKPRKLASTIEQVGMISILTLKRRSRGMFCNNIKRCHHNKRSLARSKFQIKFTFQTISATKKRNKQAMVANLRGKKVQTHHDDEVKYIFTAIE
jgi:hypothetical protein